MGRATLIIVIGLTALLCIIGGYLCSKSYRTLQHHATTTNKTIDKLFQDNNMGRK